MRLIKICMVLGVLAALTVPANALTYKQAYQGPTMWKFTNVDAGRVYVPAPGTMLNLGDTITLNATQIEQARQGTLASVLSFGAPGSVEDLTQPPSNSTREDAWGIVNLSTIAGYSTVSNSYTVPLWAAQDAVPDVYGIFYGAVDVQVTITVTDLVNVADPADDILNLQVFSAGDIGMKLYELPDQSSVVGLPTARTAQDAYPTYTGTPADLWLEGQAVAGKFTGVGAPATAKFSGSVQIRRDGTVINTGFSPNGNARLFWDIIGGSGANSNGGPVSDGNPADSFVWIEPTSGVPIGPDEDLPFLTNVYSGSGGWTTSTQDPAFNYAVPEPITMLGLMMGFGGLAGYIRKRRA